MAKKKTEELEETVEAAAEPVGEEAAVEAAPAEAAPAEALAEKKPRKKAASSKKEEASGEKPAAERTHKRAEKVGVVASDSMTKTVTVRVDRLVKHPIYRKYVRRRKKFMAHDELGAKVGDKVRIIETRPLSARKRWRVVEIIQRAEL